MFTSIKPKLDHQLFADFWVFTHSYLLRSRNCFVLTFRTISGLEQIRTAKNSKVNKQSVVIFWLKYGSVSYSFSCMSIVLSTYLVFSILFYQIFKWDFKICCTKVYLLSGDRRSKGGNWREKRNQLFSSLSLFLSAHLGENNFCRRVHIFCNYIFITELGRHCTESWKQASLL